MSKSNISKFQRIFSQGLSSANRGNPFWSQADAMIAFNAFRAAQA